MIFFHKQRLVLLSMPKTGTSSLERALGPRASIATRFPAALKHMSYGRFMKHLAPLIEATCSQTREDYVIVALMREPIAWLQSWYRYRQRDEVPGGHGTQHVSFEQFVLDYMAPERPSHATLGNQLNILRDKDRVGVDRVFPYEEFDSFVDWVSDRIGKAVDIPKVNVSKAPEPTDLSPDTLARLKAHLELPIAFHGLLSADGSVRPGHHEVMAREFARRRED